MNGGLGQLMFFVVIAAIFWFLLVRPQQQRAKQRAELMSSLAPGDEILTVGGIYATIVEVTDERLRVRVADGSELELARGAINSVVSRAGESTDGETDELDSEAAIDAIPAEKDSDA